MTISIMLRSKITVASMLLLAVIYVLAVFAPQVSPTDPYAMDPGSLLLPPSKNHLLGTDNLGRDVLSRLLYGARVSVFVPMVVVAITVAIGVPLGLISGYYGGKIDEVIMRITDIVMSFPGVSLAILLAYIAGRGIFSAALALALVGWTSMARVVRGVVMTEKEKDYVLAAKVIGKSDFRIMFEELLPNCFYPILVDAMMRLGTVIIALAGLSFIGVGVQPPEPDWGIIAAEGRKYIFEQPWLSVFPGILIIITVLAYNMIGDRLRDALDPRLRRELAGVYRVKEEEREEES
ncbi:MAG: ABC transporter permease [Thaumarchaeota archaeon]|nr:ABC transporter permease [Nitrososphaerota archaeon]